MSGLVLDVFRKVLLGRARITASEYFIDLDADPFIPEGWTVPEGCHQKGGQFKWHPSKVSLYLSEPQEYGNWIEGNKLREELKDQAVYNANVLDYLLKNPHLIPKKWKSETVFFWGTIYRYPSYAYGGLCVRNLWCFGDKWVWGYRSVDGIIRHDESAAVVVN